MFSYCRDSYILTDHVEKNVGLTYINLRMTLYLQFTSMSHLNRLRTDQISCYSQEAESRIQARNHPSLHFVLKVGNMSLLPNFGVLISKTHVAETGNVSLTLFWGIFL